MTKLVTIPDVVICRTGNWRAQSGAFNPTRADLEDAVNASNDPGFWSPRGKIGDNGPHTASRKAMGRYENLRLVDNPDGTTDVVADHVCVPEQWAAAAPSEYPNRSIEGVQNVTSDVTGKRYRLAFTAVELLGAQGPAVRSLPDLTPEQVKRGMDIAASAEAVVSDVVATLPHAALVTAGGERSEPPAGATDDQEDVMDPKAIREALNLPEDATDEQVLGAARDRGEAGNAGGNAAGNEGGNAPNPTATEAPAPAAAPVAATAQLPEGTVLLSAGQLDELKAQATAGANAMAELERQEEDRVLAQAVRETRITAAEAGTREAPGAMRRRLQVPELRQSTIVMLTAAPENGGLAPGVVPAVAAIGGPGSEDVNASAEEDRVANAWRLPGEADTKSGGNA